ncbi:putative lipoprotein [Cystobacter fuscus DSM 2262]|uniref:Lipoprotein n=1 Tax=Cystobacter fuscus (strain ATCC 25194 / DSM 2262 / NBRC 100088 / M29) TaxID=1242864 RepID=S9NX89_CYSF2|nr:vWA domain-containing protein [Cystobacter fuscus]EPX56840.1 putative lipoprotein [Cystobacter fuscus DSM 2262]
MRHSIPLSALLALTLWSGGCSTPVDAPGSTLPGTCQANAPILSAQKTDLLFVIDNSASMAEEQAAIATELPAFLEELRRDNGLEQDFRVGVITTSVYLNADINGHVQFSLYNDQAGRLQPVPDAQGRPTAERYLEGTDPELLEKFRRLVKQGTQGSGQETPFEAVRLALTPPLSTAVVGAGGNGGFLRDGARLVVVVVSDEEDCSSTQRPAPVALTTDTSRDLCSEQADQLTPVREYYQLFRGLVDGTGATREVLWATIGPVGLTDKRAELVTDTTSQGTFVRNADCPTSYGPGYRQREMASLFDSGLRNLDSVCRANFRDTLVSIASVARTSQSIEVMNLPDPRLAQVRVTREDGSIQTCSVVGGDVSYVPSAQGRAARLYFQSSCPRQLTDQKIEVKLLCAN